METRGGIEERDRAGEGEKEGERLHHWRLLGI